MRTEEEIDLIARRLHAELFEKIGDAIYAAPECQAQARRLCCAVLTAEEAEAVTDRIEQVETEREASEAAARMSVWVHRDQVKAAADYLDADRAAHVAAHGAWRLDAGKLAAALETAGVGVLPDGATDYVVAIWAEERRKGVGFPVPGLLTLHRVLAENCRDALHKAAAVRRAEVGGEADLIETESHHWETEAVSGFPDSIAGPVPPPVPPPVPKAAPPRRQYAVALVGDEGHLQGLEDMTTLHVVVAADMEDALEKAFDARAAETKRPRLSDQSSGYHYDVQPVPAAK